MPLGNIDSAHARLRGCSEELACLNKQSNVEWLRTWVKLRPQRFRHASPPVPGATTRGSFLYSAQVAAGMPVDRCSTSVGTLTSEFHVVCVPGSCNPRCRNR